MFLAHGIRVPHGLDGLTRLRTVCGFAVTSLGFANLFRIENRHFQVVHRLFVAVFCLIRAAFNWVAKSSRASA